MKPTPEELASKYLAYRDKLSRMEEAHKASIAPYKAAMEVLEGLASEYLDDLQCSSVKTNEGTIYHSTLTTPKVVDKDAFTDFVAEHGAWDLITSAISKEAYNDYLEKQLIVPGVEVSSIRRTHFRKP